MKTTFLAMIFLAFAVLIPQKTMAQVGVSDKFATAQSKANTKNAQRQTDAVDDIKKTFERTTALIGVGSPSNFSKARESIKKNLEEKIKNIGQNPLSSGPFYKWKLGDADYQYENRSSGAIEAALSSFIKNEESSTMTKNTSVKKDMDKLKLHHKMGTQFVMNTASTALGNAVATKAEIDSREEVLKDIEETISGSQSVRDDMIGNTLLLLASAHYYQQLLNLYANGVEMAVASDVNKMIR